MIKAKRILALAPHTDDIELGCGASIVRFIREGGHVKSLAFSACEEWVPDDFPPNILRSEMMSANAILGIDKSDVHIHEFRATELWKVREQIFDILFEIEKAFSPEIVFCPSRYDLHQDHSCVAAEAERVFKNSTLLGYEVPWNNRQFVPTCHIKVTQIDLDTKIAALNEYNSQKYKSYVDEDFIKSQAVFRGQQIKGQLAESFEVIKLTL